MAPTARHGRNCFGSLLPSSSPPNARSSGFASDLKMKIRMAAPRRGVTSLSLSARSPSIARSPPPELIALCRTVDRAGTLILVPEDQSAFFQIVGRHFDGHPIARERLDPVLLHSAGRVGDERMAVVELNAIARVGQYLGDKALELQEFFFRHGLVLLHD